MLKGTKRASVPNIQHLKQSIK